MWEKMIKDAEAAASAAWQRMQDARARGDSRAEKKAFRESEKFRDDAARFRAQCADWKPSSSGFAS